jgi:hypothetical protein
MELPGASELTMTTEYLNTLLLGVVGFFLSKASTKMDKVDDSVKNIGTDIALIKQDRQLIWDKIRQMENDIEELKRLLIRSQ